MIRVTLAYILLFQIFGYSSIEAQLAIQSEKQLPRDAQKIISSLFHLDNPLDPGSNGFLNSIVHKTKEASTSADLIKGDSISASVHDRVNNFSSSYNFLAHLLYIRALLFPNHFFW